MMEAVAATTGEVLRPLDRLGKQKHTVRTTNHAQSYKRVLHSLTVKPTANGRGGGKPLAF